MKILDGQPLRFNLQSFSKSISPSLLSSAHLMLVLERQTPPKQTYSSPCQTLKPATNASHHMSKAPTIPRPLSNNLILALLFPFFPMQSLAPSISYHSQRKISLQWASENIQRDHHSALSLHFYSVIGEIYILHSCPFPDGGEC